MYTVSQICTVTASSGVVQTNHVGAPFPFPYPPFSLSPRLSSLPFSFLSFPLKVAPPPIAARMPGGGFSYLSGSGHSATAKRYLVTSG